MNGERELYNALVDGIAVAAVAGYYPQRFVKMMERQDVVSLCKQFVKSGELQSGLRRLNDMGLIEHSLEHLVAHDERFKGLFTKMEREAAVWRLSQLTEPVG